MASLMLSMCITIFGSGNALALNSGFLLPKVLQSLKPKVCMWDFQSISGVNDLKEFQGNLLVLTLKIRRLVILE